MPVASDFDRLYEHGQKFAKQLLESNGEFYPLGITVDLKGDLQYVAAQDAAALDPEHPHSQDLIEILSNEFKRQADSGAIRACGIYFDVYVTDPKLDKRQDAIQCHLEHTNGDSVDVFQPYTKGDTGAPDYLEAYSQTSQPRIFMPMQWGTATHKSGMIDLTLTLENQPPLSPPTLAQLSAAVDFLTPAGGPGFLVLESNAGDYTQTAGGDGRFTAEWRMYSDGHFRHFVAGIPARRSAEDVEIPTNGSVVTVKENEILDPNDVKAILVAFTETRLLPQRFVWRDITQRFV